MKPTCTPRGSTLRFFPNECRRVRAWSLLSHLLTAGTLLHAQSVIQFSAATYNVTEGAPEVALLVQRTNDLYTVVSVDFLTTTSGSATTDADYTEVAATLTFLANETNKTVAVPILNDGLVEPLETFQVTLSNATGGAVIGARTNATVRITDHDKGLAFEFGSYRATENEPYVLVGVTRGDDGNSPINVDVATSDITALAGADYTGLTNTLSFAPGERLKLLTIPILNDGLKEVNEAFRLTLSNSTGGGVLGSPTIATVTLIDNDPRVQFTYPWSGEFTSVSYGAHEYEGTAAVVITRGNDVLLEPFTVHYAAQDLTATNGVDYVLSEGVMEFAAGEMSRTLSIPITNDGVTEGDERFQVVLSEPTGGMALGRFTNVTVTIWDSTGWAPHGFGGIRSLGAHTMELTLVGGVPTRFRPFFDLYLLDASSDLDAWAPWSYALRTNTASTASVLQFGATGEPTRFFRTRSEMLVTPRLPPTGPYAVGKLNRWVADPTRRNRYNVSTNSSMWMTVWYPAIRPAGQLPGRFIEEPIARYNSVLGAWTDRLRCMRNGSFLHAPWVDGSTRFPVVFDSHGLGAWRENSEEKAENLASHGYVVVATDHLDAVNGLGVVFPDGSYHNAPQGPATTDAGLQSRVQDFRFMLAQLDLWNQDDPFFAGRLDLNRVAAMGYSWGGATAAEFCRTEPRCQAAVLFDPGAFSADTLNQGLLKPSLTINRSDNSDTGVFPRSSAESVWLRLTDTNHDSVDQVAFVFSGYPIASVLEASRTYQAYLLAFMNRHVKGETVTFPLAGFPRAVDVRHK